MNVGALDHSAAHLVAAYPLSAPTGVCICKELEEFSEQDKSGALNNGNNEETGEPNLASHGASLLQSAFGEKPVDSTDDAGARRKPLSDIGNTLVCFLCHCSFAMR